MDLRGITEKIMANGEKNIMVRFKFQSRTYPVKNFTKLFGSRTRKEAGLMLIEVKAELAKGKNPFKKTKEFLNDIWEHKIEQNRKNGEWGEGTIKSYTVFYDKYLRKAIGNKKIENIKYKDLKDIKDNMKGVGATTKNTIRRILSPIFEEAIKNKIISSNEAKLLDREEQKTNKNISLRSSDNALEIVRKLFKAVEYLTTKNHKQKEEIHMYLYLLIFTAHRKGELIKLRKEDLIIEENKIIAPAPITKIKEEIHFPIPPICLDYFISIEEGLLFPTFSYKSIFEVFQRLVKLSGIQLYKGKNITPHDLRRLMLNIMVTKCGIDSVLADTCLSHKQTGMIKHYVSFEFNDIQKAYEKYWKAIKEEEIIEDKIEVTDKTDKLLKLSDLLEKDLISKEEFLEHKSFLS